MNPPQPAPIPQAWSIEDVKVDTKGGATHLTFFSATGQYHVFLDPDSADTLADQLHTSAANGRTGLLLPPGSGSLIVAKG